MHVHEALVVWYGAVFVKRRGGGCVSVETSKECDHSTTEPGFSMPGFFEEYKRAMQGGWVVRAPCGLVGRGETSQPVVAAPLFALQPCR